MVQPLKAFMGRKAGKFITIAKELAGTGIEAEAVSFLACGAIINALGLGIDEMKGIASHKEQELDRELKDFMRSAIMIGAPSDAGKRGRNAFFNGSSTGDGGGQGSRYYQRLNIKTQLNLCAKLLRSNANAVKDCFKRQQEGEHRMRNILVFSAAITLLTICTANARCNWEGEYICTGAPCQQPPSAKPTVKNLGSGKYELLNEHGNTSSAHLSGARMLPESGGYYGTISRDCKDIDWHNNTQWRR
jgi:hypothetical protein